MASLFLRSAAGRVLRQSMPQGSFPRSPVRLFSGGVGRIESRYSSSKYGKSPAHGAFEEFGDNNLRELRKLHVEAQSMVEQGKRLEQKQAQRQTVLSFIIFPTLAALYIFGPDKKDNCQTPIELSEAHGNL